ncbi:putative L-type lectin-domain containing receptor kinase VI.1 [Lachnellula suecica]|uniref:Putative L-type lectin-domain containing receptor kinase VI.1 n=1 Tax=Lachnellula suecica TaxID=602035 RepID=A0A8T9CCA6_9HELO|nr:putative L-type lectin-domain containing receptor kinase VI.1 [Lachnellula suecica]
MSRNCWQPICHILGLSKHSKTNQPRSSPDSEEVNSSWKESISRHVGWGGLHSNTDEARRPLLIAGLRNSPRKSQENFSDGRLHSPLNPLLVDFQSNGGSSRGSQETFRAVTPSTLGRSPIDGTELNHALSYPRRRNTGSILQEALIDARHEWPPDQNSYFIPVDSLEDLLSVDTITAELEGYQLDSTTTGSNQHLAQLISINASKLFAILVCLGLGESIRQFLDEDITDKDLPFKRLDETETTGTPKKRLCSRLRRNKPIKCMESWGRQRIRNFDREQWYVLAPVFNNCEDVGVPHYDFGKNQVLPFLKDGEQSDQVKEGGYSTVWEIKIHPAHQKLHHNADSEGATPSIALKRLHSTQEEDFASEVEMLKAFVNPGHPHLVKLLATYRHKNRYYLLFPFAKSTLRKFWEDNPLPKLTEGLLFWSLHQCKAIASALYLIHERQTTQNHADWERIKGDNSDLPGIEDDDRIFGRHGDIKPENILLSDEVDKVHEEHCKCLPSQGFLLIADFGLMDFHKRLTRSKVLAEKIGGSQTYEPPEMRLDKKISRAYDIWSLGCLYLEFITWMLCGWEGLSNFPKARGMTETPGMNDDTFYTIEYPQDGSGPRAVLRESVKDWISNLHENYRSSLFIHEFLDLVEYKMLVVDRSERITCGRLNIELREMVEKGEKENSLRYFIKPSTWLPRAKDSRQKPISKRAPASETAISAPESTGLRRSKTFA